MEQISPKQVHLKEWLNLTFLGKYKPHILSLFRKCGINRFLSRFKTKLKKKVKLKLCSTHPNTTRSESIMRQGSYFIGYEVIIGFQTFILIHRGIYQLLPGILSVGSRLADLHENIFFMEITCIWDC